MKRLSFLLAALAIILAGCSDDETENEVSQGAVPFVKGQKVTLTATADASGNVVDAKTRAASSVNGSNIDFKWSDGDALTVTVGDTSAIFTMKSGAGEAEATFEGTMPADGSTFDASFGSSSIPTSQTYSATAPIPSEAMYFTASNCTLNGSLTLQPQTPALKLNLYGTSITVKRIEVKPESGSTYTLTCSSGVTLGTTEANATPFYIVVPTGSYKFSVTVYDDAEICSFDKTSVSEIAAGKYLNMPAKEVKKDHEYVDLGLSIKWATCNVGASKPEEYGDYFAWGETTGYNSGKTNFNWNTYTLCNGTYKTMTKYCTSTTYGTVDNNTDLDAEDDAATVNWGSDWRMPTYDECQELLNADNCTWTWTQVNGIKGYRVTSKKSGYTDKSIFLPAAGFRENADLYNAGDYCYYWSGSLDAGNSSNAWYVYLFSYKHIMSYGYRYYGHSVRPVHE